MDSLEEKSDDVKLVDCEIRAAIDKARIFIRAAFQCEKDENAITFLKGADYVLRKALDAAVERRSGSDIFLRNLNRAIQSHQQNMTCLKLWSKGGRA